MSNTNCKNMEDCDYCYSCYSCDYCYSCYSCDSCNSCDSCYSCYYCNSCDYCYYCNSCDYCYSCYSCYYCNSCDSCKGLRMSERMLFCLGNGKYESKGDGYQKNNQIFNVQLTPDEWDKIKKPNIKLPITKWIDKSDMTTQEKKDKPVYKEIGGYLKVLSYEDAWAKWWAENDHEEILNLPHFDFDIFQKITGLDVKALKAKEETIEIEGKKYTVTEIKKALNNPLGGDVK